MLVAKREGKKIAANGGILIEQLVNPACHECTSMHRYVDNIGDVLVML